MENTKYDVNTEEYVVVTDALHRSDTDLGYRVYKADDPYLDDATHEYSVEGYFSTIDEAKVFISKEIDKYYSDGYDE